MSQDTSRQDFEQMWRALQEPIETLRKQVNSLSRQSARAEVAGEVEGSSASVRNSSNISIPDSVTTPLTFDTEYWDTDDYHSLVLNIGRLTVPVGGFYLVTASIKWTATLTGRCELSITHSVGGVIGYQSIGTPAIYDGLSIALPWRANAGTYFTVSVYQNSGSSQNIAGGVSYSPVFSIVRLGIL